MPKRNSNGDQENHKTSVNDRLYVSERIGFQFNVKVVVFFPQIYKIWTVYNKNTTYVMLHAQ